MKRISLAALFVFCVALLTAASVNAQQPTPPPIPPAIQTRVSLMSETVDAKLVFGVLASTNGNWQLGFANINGANFTLLTKDDAYRSEPSFAPDATRFVFSKWTQGKPELYIYDLVSKSESALNVKGYAPAWSPDGKLIAYLSESSELSLYTLATKATKGLKQGFASGSRPAWSPDSAQLVIAGLKGKDTQAGVAVFDLEGKGVRLLFEGDALNPTWATTIGAADGGNVVFQAHNDGQSADQWDLYVVSASDGKNLKRLTKDGGMFPAFAPDGLRIAFFNKGAIYTIYKDGSGYAIATDLKAAVQFPSWQP
jgi:TolB protein